LYETTQEAQLLSEVVPHFGSCFVLTIYHQANDHHQILKTRPLVLDASPFIEFEFSVNSPWTGDFISILVAD